MPESMSSPGLKVWPPTPTEETVAGQPAEDEAEIPTPTFPHRAYGVDLSWLGEEGGMIARGHVPDLRFAAACNHLARVECGFTNIWDDRTTTLDDVLSVAVRCWALPIAPMDSYFEWAVDLSSRITEQTPGAIPVTTLMP